MWGVSEGRVRRTAGSLACVTGCYCGGQRYRREAILEVRKKGDGFSFGNVEIEVQVGNPVHLQKA